MRGALDIRIWIARELFAVGQLFTWRAAEHVSGLGVCGELFAWRAAEHGGELGIWRGLEQDGGQLF